jgi:hypothetical protein
MRSLVNSVLLACLVVPVVAQSPQTRQTASEFYLGYRAVVARATSIDDLLSLWTLDQAQGYRASPPNERVSLDDIRKIYAMHTNVKVVKETASARSTTLDLQGQRADSKTTNGTVDVAMEGAAWKVAGLESWDQ